MSDWKWSISPTHEGMVRAIETMNCGLVVEDERGVILYANRRLLEWSGYEVEEIEGQHLSTFLPKEMHEVLAAERMSVLEGDLRTRISVIRRKDGRVFPVAVAPQVGPRGDSEERAVMSVLIDLAEVQAARPLGAPEGSLASELSVVAMRLQALSFSAAIASEDVTPIDHLILRELSTREKEILAHLVSGSRVPSIAKQLFISHHTVRNHLKAIFRKVNVSSQSELIDLIRKLGKTEAG